MIPPRESPHNVAELPTIPANFDAEQFPILSRHWPGLFAPDINTTRLPTSSIDQPLLEVAAL